MRIKEKVPPDDSLPEKNVYTIEVVSLAAVPAPPHPPIPKPPAFDTPWYMHVANHLAADIEPPEFYGYKNKKF